MDGPLTDRKMIRPHRQRMLRQRVLNSLRAGLGPIVGGRVLGNDAEAPMSEVDQVPGRAIERFVVIRSDRCSMRVGIVDKHVELRYVVLRQELRQVGVMQFANQQNGIDTALDELLDLPKLLIEVVCRAGQQQRVAEPGKFALQPVDGTGEVAMREGGKDGTYRAGAA